jgi:cellulose synthase/poly-beta-1,6-N-acetylglucosamine synthase-like glycosyltransferase
MTLALSCILIALSTLLAVPAAIIFMEVVAAIMLPRKREQLQQNGNRPRVAVLVPAHNESSNLLPTIEDVKRQMRTGDRLLVVADNCVDDTAAVAGAAGAEVIERADLTKIGKGFALDFGIRHLCGDPPTVVVIVDADCKIADGAIDRLAAACAATHRPVQSLYLLNAPDDSAISYRVSEFALRVKNRLRPLGLHALNLPCQLMGTGMAFPWDVIRRVDLANGSIVEDLKLGLNLAQLGSPPLFCASAGVSSHFPFSESGAKTQRERWETGHVRMILAEGPRYLFYAIVRRNLGLLALTLDLAVPPLSLYMSLLVAMVFITGVATYFDVSVAGLIISSASLLLLTLALSLAWLKCGREILPPSAFLLVVKFLFAKFPLYVRIMCNRATSHWVRTDRQKLN